MTLQDKSTDGRQRERILEIRFYFSQNSCRLVLISSKWLVIDADLALVSDNHGQMQLFFSTSSKVPNMVKPETRSRSAAIITIEEDKKEQDELLLPFDVPEVRKEKSEDSKQDDPPFPVVDDIYDECILTDPDHVLSSLNKNYLLHRVL